MIADAPIPGLLIPKPCFVRDGATGEVHFKEDPNGAAGEVEIILAHAPLLITGRLRDADENVEALHLSWKRFNGWRHKTADRGTVLDARKLVTLADDGAPVTSANAKDIVVYLDAMESANLRQLPAARVSSHLEPVMHSEP